MFKKNFNNKDDDNVSEADPNDIANLLKETEDLDGNLFKSISRTTSSSNTKTLTKSGGVGGKTVMFNDDPLDDIEKIAGGLFDSKSTSQQQPIRYQSSFSMDDLNKTTTAANKSRPAVGKQMSMSTAKTNTKSLFDDESSELLFGTNPRLSKAQAAPSLSTTMPATSSSSSGNANANNQAAASAAKNNDDDFLFGGYVPSTMTSTMASSSAANKRGSFLSAGAGIAGGGDNDLFKTITSSATTRAINDDQFKSGSSQKFSKSFEDLFDSNINSLDAALSNVAQPAGTTTRKSTEYLSSSSKPSIVVNTAAAAADSELLFSPNSIKETSNKEMIMGRYNTATTIGSSSSSSAAKPPLPSNKDLLLTDTDFNINKQQQQQQKESVNSSFADSVVDNNNDLMMINLGGNGTNNKNIISNHHHHKPTATSSVKDPYDDWFGSNLNNNKNKPPLSKQQQHSSSNQNQNLSEEIREHYESQIKMIRENNESKLRLINENHANLMQYLQKENQSLKNQIEHADAEKQELIEQQKRKLSEAKQEYESELEKIKELHTISIKNLKKEHQEVLETLKQMKANELEAALAATSHTKKIEDVILKIDDNTKYLSGISHKIEKNQTAGMNEAENQLRHRENQLKIQEERLLKQQREYESEIKLLNETIQRLEAHLSEQTRLVTQERWHAKQQEKKVEALQEALVNEQRIVMEKLTRERGDIDRSKDDLLNEQKRLMQQVYEERRKISEEKAHLEASLKAYKDKMHHDSMQTINTEAQLAVLNRSLADEKSRLEIYKRELEQFEKTLKQEREKIDLKAADVEAKVSRIEQMSMLVSQKHQQAEELLRKSTQEKEMQMKIFEQANKIKVNHDSRLDQIQQQMVVLNEKEAFVNQEKVNLYKMKQEIENLKKTFICTKCKGPQTEPLLQSQSQNFLGTFPLTSTVNNNGIFRLNPNVSSFMRTVLNNNNNSSQIDDDKIVRQLRLDALKDRQFLTEEKHFLETL